MIIFLSFLYLSQMRKLVQVAFGVFKSEKSFDFILQEALPG